jgi:uncharacterized integral membrane protein
VKTPDGITPATADVKTTNGTNNGDKENGWDRSNKLWILLLVLIIVIFIIVMYAIHRGNNVELNIHVKLK